MTEPVESMVSHPIRLLWAISHQTLARAELPILAEAGFDVVPEEPQREGGLWERDFVSYPTVDPVEPNLVPMCATGDLGSRLRLALRQGHVSDGEAQWVNAAFDAVMVAAPPKVAVNVASWFRGTVLYRWYGSIPGQRDFSVDLGPVPSNVLGVPIFSTLVATQLGQSFSRCHLLGTTVPRPPVEVRADRALDRNTTAVFAGLVSDEPWFDEWVARLAAAAGPTDIQVFGVPSQRRASVESAGPRVHCLPRLSDEDYWHEFADCSLAVYPHSSPYHSHYVPLEAIQLGIPCLMTAQGAIAREVAAQGTVDLANAGVLVDRDALLGWVRDHAQSPEKRAALLRRQEALLQPFSHSHVLEQARDLREFVAGASARGPEPSRAPSPQLGIPSVLPLVRGLRHGLTSPVSLSPSTICAPAKPFFITQYRGQFLVEPDGSVVRIRPPREDDSLLRIGLANASGHNNEITVRLRCTPVPELPIVAEMPKSDDPADVVTYLFSPASGQERRRAESDWLVSLPVARDRFVQLRIVGALTPPDYVVDEVTLDPCPGAEGSAGRSLPAQQALGAQGEIPAGAFAHTARAPAWITRLSSGWIGAVRIPVDHDDASVLRVRSERVAAGIRAPHFCVVLVREAAPRRTVPVGVFLGGRRIWSREVRLEPDSVPLVLGTGAATLALRLYVGANLQSATQEVERS